MKSYQEQMQVIKRAMENDGIVPRTPNAIDCIESLSKPANGNNVQSMKTGVEIIAEESERQIKSQKAQEILENAWTSAGMTVWKDGAIKAIIAAETEAEERHAKELQKIKDRALDAFKKSCAFHKEEGCFGNFLKNNINNTNLTLECTSDCGFFNTFITELNK